MNLLVAFSTTDHGILMERLAELGVGTLLWWSNSNLVVQYRKVDVEDCSLAQWPERRAAGWGESCWQGLYTHLLISWPVGTWSPPKLGGRAAGSTACPPASWDHLVSRGGGTLKAAFPLPSSTLLREGVLSWWRHAPPCLLHTTLEKFLTMGLAMLPLS